MTGWPRAKNIRACASFDRASSSASAASGLVHPLQEVPDASHVVVPEERRHARTRCCRRPCSSRRRRRTFVGASVGPLCDANPRAASWNAKSMVDWRRPAVEKWLRNGGPNCWSNTSPKAKKSAMPRRLGGSQDVRPEHLPELQVHVLGRVDPEPVDTELLDPEGSRCRPCPRPPRGAPSTGRRGRRSRRRASSRRRSRCCPGCGTAADR